MPTGIQGIPGYEAYDSGLLNTYIQGGNIQLTHPQTGEPIIAVTPEGRPITASMAAGLAGLGPISMNGPTIIDPDQAINGLNAANAQAAAENARLAAEATARYNSTYRATSGFDLTRPGAAELVFSSTQGQLSGPGAVERFAANGQANWQGAQQSSTAQQALNYLAPGLSQRAPGENFAYSANPNAGQAMSTYQQTRGQVEGPTRLGQYVQQGAPQVTSGQTASQTYGLVAGSNLQGVAANAPRSYGEARGQTSSAQTQAQTQGAVTGPSQSQQYQQQYNYGQDVNRTVSGQMLPNSQGLIAQAGQHPTNYSQQAAQNPAGYNQAAARTASANNYVQNQPQLQRASNSETLDRSGAIFRAVGNTQAGQYNQSLQGKDPVVPQDMSAYYDRQRQVAQAGIDRAMAARGGYKSSAALDQSREALVDIGAQQARDEANYGLAAADLRNRILGGAAQAADASGMDFYRSQLAGAQGADQSRIARLGLSGQQAAQADAASLGLYRTQLDNAVAADQLGIARGNLDVNRFNALNAAANNADASAINLGRLGLDISGQADQTGLARYVAANQVANNVDQASLGLANYGLSAASQADANALARYLGINTVANNVDQANLASYLGQGELLQGADTLDVNRFIANNTAANNASQTNIDAYTAQANATNAADRLGLARSELMLNGARQADLSALGIYGAGLDTAAQQDAALRSRLGLLYDGAQSADNSMRQRSGLALTAQNGLTAAALGLTNAQFEALLGGDQQFFDQGQQLGLGGDYINLGGALTNQGTTAAMGAGMVQTGGQIDANNRQILSQIPFKKTA